MENKNLMPIASPPVNRIATGQLPIELAELSEEALSQLGEDASKAVIASFEGIGRKICLCSYDGDDAE